MLSDLHLVTMPLGAKRLAPSAVPSMLLFLSDSHLGRHGAAIDREVERDMVACLRAHEQDVERLYLLGDVFDYYIEYRNVIPKGFARLQGLLAEWSDAGIPITYIVGNHDPWHVRYFEEELGVRVVFDEMQERRYGRSVYLAHGDLLSRRGVIRRGMEHLLRHPIPVWLYKNLLPADVGIFLARVSSRALGEGAVEVDPEVVKSLREFAEDRTKNGEADVVILAHAHEAEHTRWSHGDYINTGCWYRERSLARMTEDGVELCVWNGSEAVLRNAPAPAFKS